MPNYDRTPTTSQVIQSGLNAVGTAVDIRDKIIRDQCITDLLHAQAQYDQDENDFLMRLQNSNKYEEYQSLADDFMAKKKSAMKENNSAYYARNSFTAKKMDEMFARQDAALRNKVKQIEYQKRMEDTMAKQNDLINQYMASSNGQDAYNKIAPIVDTWYQNGYINAEQYRATLDSYQDQVTVSSYNKVFDQYKDYAIQEGMTPEEYARWLKENHSEEWKVNGYNIPSSFAYPMAGMPEETNKPITKKPRTKKEAAIQTVKDLTGRDTITEEMVKDAKFIIDDNKVTTNFDNLGTYHTNVLKDNMGLKDFSKSKEFIDAINTLSQEGDEQLEEVVNTENENNKMPPHLSRFHDSSKAVDTASKTKKQEYQAQITTMQQKNAGYFSEQVTKMFQIKDPVNQYYFAQSQLRDIEKNYTGLKLSENDRLQYNNIFNVILKAASDKEGGGKVSNAGDALKLMESWWKTNPDSYIASWMQGGHESIFANAYVMKEALVTDFQEYAEGIGIDPSLIKYSLSQNKPIIEGIVEKAVETRYGSGKSSSGKSSILKQVENMFKDLKEKAKKDKNMNEYDATEDQLRYVAQWAIDNTAAKTVQNYSDSDFADDVRTMVETVYTMNSKDLFMDNVATASNFGKALATFETKDMVFTDQYGDYRWLPVGNGTVQKQWEQEGGIYDQGRKNLAYALDGININDIEKVPQYTDQPGKYDVTNRAEYKVKGKGTYYFEAVDKNGKPALTSQDAIGYRIVNKDTEEQVYNSVTDAKNGVKTTTPAQQAKEETNKQVKIRNERTKLEQIYPADSLSYENGKWIVDNDKLPGYFKTFTSAVNPERMLDMSSEEIEQWKTSIEEAKKNPIDETKKNTKKEKKTKKSKK